MPPSKSNQDIDGEHTISLKSSSNNRLGPLKKSIVRHVLEILVLSFSVKIFKDFVEFLHASITKSNAINRQSYSFILHYIFLSSCSFLVFFCEFYYAPLISSLVPHISLPIGSYSSRKLFLEGSSSRIQERKGMSNCEVLRHVVIEETLLNNFKLYENICRSLLR